MNRLYPAAKARLWQGDLDLTGTVSAQLVGAYAYDDTHSALGDVDHRIGAPVTVNVTSIDAGTVTIDPLTFVAVTASEHVLGVVFYDAGGLIGYVDRRGDTVAIDIAPNGSDLVMTFPYLFDLP